MFFMLIIAPIMMLFTNHNIFFIVIGFILWVASLKNIHTILFKSKKSSIQVEKSDVNDLESVIDIDLKKFGTGTKVVKNLMIILFLVYCSFFVNAFILKALTTAIIIYRIHIVLKSILNPKSILSVKNSNLKSLLLILVNLTTIILIAIVTCNKFIRKVI